MKNKSNVQLKFIGSLILSVGLLAKTFGPPGKISELLTAFVIGIGIGIVLFSTFRQKLRPNC